MSERDGPNSVFGDECFRGCTGLKYLAPFIPKHACLWIKWDYSYPPHPWMIPALTSLCPFVCGTQWISPTRRNCLDDGYIPATNCVFGFSLVLHSQSHNANVELVAAHRVLAERRGAIALRLGTGSGPKRAAVFYQVKLIFTTHHP